jgi:hypothetical protein
MRGKTQGGEKEIRKYCGTVDTYLSFIEDDDGNTNKNVLNKQIWVIKIYI